MLVYELINQAFIVYAVSTRGFPDIDSMNDDLYCLLESYDVVLHFSKTSVDY